MDTFCSKVHISTEVIGFAKNCHFWGLYNIETVIILQLNFLIGMILIGHVYSDQLCENEYAER